MRKYIYVGLIILIAVVFISCDLSDLFVDKSVKPAPLPKFDITSVRFYKNINTNMQDPTLYPDDEYIEGNIVDNNIYVYFNDRVFVKDGKRSININPTIEHTGDSIAPEEVVTITQDRTDYILTKGDRTKTYTIVILTGTEVDDIVIPEEDFGITSVRFYKNINTNMQDPGLYPDTDYIDADIKGTSVQADFKYQVFRKNGKRVFIINPSIIYTGDSITPDPVAAITTNPIEYIVTKGDRTKTYTIRLNVNEDSIPISLNLKRGGIPLQYMGTNVWGMTGLPWDITPLRGKSKSVTMDWDGDINFPKTSLVLPSITKFTKNGHEYKLELKLNEIPIVYPVKARQNGRSLSIHNRVLYVLPKKDGTTIDIEFVKNAIISNINNGEFDNHQFTNSEKYKLTYIKNGDLETDYNSEREVAFFNVQVGGNVLRYSIVIRRYAGDSISFYNRSRFPFGDSIFPIENYVDIKFEKQDDTGFITTGATREIPAGQRIITIETNSLFQIIINDNDEKQYQTVDDNNELRDPAWMALHSVSNHNFSVRSNEQLYEVDKSDITKHDSVSGVFGYYYVNVVLLQDKPVTEIMRLKYTYTDKMSYVDKYEKKHPHTSVVLNKPNDCTDTYTPGSCYHADTRTSDYPRRIPQDYWVAEHILGFKPADVVDYNKIIKKGTYEFTRTVETIIYYKKP